MRESWTGLPASAETDGQFGFRAHGAMMASTRPVDTLHQATDNIPWPLQRLDPMPPMITDVHLPTAVPTLAVFHIQKYSYKFRVVRRPMSDRFASLHPPMDAGSLPHYPPTSQDHS